MIKVPMTPIEKDAMGKVAVMIGKRVLTPGFDLDMGVKLYDAYDALYDLFEEAERGEAAPLTLFERMEAAPRRSVVCNKENGRRYEKRFYDLWYIVRDSGILGTVGYSPAAFPESQYILEEYNE